jgi:hypothetical protein
MKAFKHFFCFGICLLVLMYTACQKKVDKDTCDILIIDDWVQSPEWLVQEIDSIINVFNNNVYYPPDYIIVQSIKHLEQDYILVKYLFSRTVSDGYIFYACSGKKIAPNSKLWRNLLDEILPCGITVADDRILSPQWLVQVYDSVANLREGYEPWVFYLNNDAQDYILVRDNFGKTNSDIYSFFTCQDERVVPESDLWKTLVKEYSKGNSVRIMWRRDT